ncbi:unnamed protein product, partial [Laminaria digitata]
EACADFRTGYYPGSAWTFDDCVDVWKRYARTTSPDLRGRLPHVDTWRQTASELRRVGSPCLVASDPTSDGAGSSTIRHIATWIFADEMGCDWVTPDWGKKRVDGGNGTVLYCHRIATAAELEFAKTIKDLRAMRQELRAMRQCSVIDFLAYFQFDVPSVDLPEKGTVEIIQASAELNLTDANERVKMELENAGFVNAPNTTVIFTIHPNFASEYLTSLGNWDEARRRSVRTVLHEARQNFHRHPRPWYDENPDCAFVSTRLNVAMHVRMGDRRAFQDGSLDYFGHLEVFMDKVRQEVVGMGLETPLFHIFSETLVPCPSEETGLFDEFPIWPVKLDQIPACLEAKEPDDCAEKRTKIRPFCNAIRSGIFHVAGMPLVLHVGQNVQNAMSCMIQADALLMGCSTFGQVAGLLTKGISLFSTSCDGNYTLPQYRTTPPLAMAERGYLWVPVAGSWRNPVLESTELLRGALDELMAARGGF